VSFVGINQDSPRTFYTLCIPNFELYVPGTSIPSISWGPNISCIPSIPNIPEFHEREGRDSHVADPASDEEINQLHDRAGEVHDQRGRLTRRHRTTVNLDYNTAAVLGDPE
jgi:hypothetical protein